LVVLSALRLAYTKALALRVTVISENGATLYSTLIGTEEYPKVQEASATLETTPLVFLTYTFKYGKGVYLAAVDVAVKVTQYQDKAVVAAVPRAAQVLRSPYLAVRVAGAVTNVVPSIANEISLLNIAPVPAGIIHNILVASV